MDTHRPRPSCDPSGAAEAPARRAVPGAGRALAALRAAARLGLPAACAGCGRWEVTLCQDCRALLAAAPEPVSADAAGDVRVHAVAAYAGPVRSLVLGWKNGAREDLDAVMDAVGAEAGESWAAHLDGETRSRIVSARALLVVPAPSGPARRLRGRLVAARLADAVALGAATGLGLPEAGARTPTAVLSTDVLRRARGSGRSHQAGGSVRQRRRNRSTPPRVLADVSGHAVLLVDDVVTTGATLGACARALAQAGADVVGALTVAAAPSPRRPAGGLLPARHKGLTGVGGTGSSRGAGDPAMV